MIEEVKGGGKEKGRKRDGVFMVARKSSQFRRLLKVFMVAGRVSSSIKVLEVIMVAGSLIGTIEALKVSNGSAIVLSAEANTLSDPAKWESVTQGPNMLRMAYEKGKTRGAMIPHI